MNRIILIGNGFDRAHDLETAYKHFIDWFWKQQAKELRTAIAENGKTKYENDFISFSISSTELYGSVYENDLKPFLSDAESITSYKQLIDSINRFEDKFIYYRSHLKSQNTFLQYISNHSDLENWVDIEEAYHLFLNKIFNVEFVKYREGNYRYTNIYQFHQDFKNIQDALEQYLLEVLSYQVQPPIEGLQELFYSPFRVDDFSSKTQTELEDEIRIDTLPSLNDNPIAIGNPIPTRIFNLPLENILFLTFNYTNLESLYTSKISDNIIHIHGELNKPENPIIFGYGDELCSEYKELERLNDNEYLANIKSIKYLETSNYKRLLSYIESDQYQIFILGHSCGVSDRTLLNALFEHPNCVSIKVFYHGNREKNNYSDVVRNISRNFNDKVSFRDKVVNKEYCQPMPQKTENS